MAGDTAPLVGRCYCGKVKYKSTAAPSGMTFCYCTTCRSLHGGPFAPFTNVKRENFQWIDTEGLVQMHCSSIATRAVCKLCHAPMTMAYDAAPDEIGIVASSVDEEASQATVPEVEQHIFVHQKARWYKILDGAPQFQGPTDEMRNFFA